VACAVDAGFVPWVSVEENALAAFAIWFLLFDLDAFFAFAFDLRTLATTFEVTGTAIVAPRSIRIAWQSGFALSEAGWRQSLTYWPTKLAGTVRVNIGTRALTVFPVVPGHFMPTPGTKDAGIAFA
jgi:hypothetical protein